MWGVEINAEEKYAYPIRTYAEFEQKGRKSDERDVDPVAFFNEFIQNLPSDEALLLQFVVKPALPDWKKHGEEEMKRVQATLRIYEDGKYTGKAERETEGIKTRWKAIDDKIGKDGFKTIIRYLHIGPKRTFNFFTGYRNFYAFFTQLNHDYNRFTKNTKVWTKRDWYNFPFIFPNYQVSQRKEHIYYEYIKRYFTEQTWFGQLMRSDIIWRRGFSHKITYFNTEELATMFHPPTNIVITTGIMDRIESKRIAPPSNLPG